MRVAVSMSPVMNKLNAWKSCLTFAHAMGVVPTVVVRRGEDLEAARLVERTKLGERVFPVDWASGSYSGMLRNGDMLCHADSLVVLWMEDDRSTSNLIQQAQHMGMPTYVKNYRTGVVTQTAGRPGTACGDLFATI